MNKYRTLYIDPPWQVKAGRSLGNYVMEDGKQLFSGNCDKARELAYPQMTLQQICDMDIQSLAAEQCHLHLWVINKYVPDIKQVLGAWGFKYSTIRTWCKKPMGGGLGGAFGQSTEHLVFATKGKVDAKGRITGTSFHYKRPYVNGYPCHSKKPDECYADIEKVSHGPYLEMFARQNWPEWDAWGNQAPNSISLPSNALQGITQASTVVSL